MTKPKKYINTPETAKLTGHSYNEILRLAKEGVLANHKTRRGHYRLEVVALEKYFGIQINIPEDEAGKVTPKVLPKTAPRVVQKERSSVDRKVLVRAAQSLMEKTVHDGPVSGYADENKSSSNETCLILNDNHYEEVIERICTAKTSIRIMTANFKRFNLKPTQKQGVNYKDGTPFIKYLMTKAVQGVSVQIICSRPSQNFLKEWQEYYKQMGRPGLFDYEFCERNHAKIIIIDDRLAYIGSANVTPAGLGQGTFSPGNFEAGILTSNPQIISSLKAHFAKIMNEEYCSSCHRAEKCERCVTPEF
jgi:phosphatidylserine/phosphatidylglycerophosphate/cardiolipin synthase-like enzyme